MPNNSSITRSIVDIVGTGAALVSYFSHAAYTGWAGVGKALLTGVGTEIGTGLGMGIGALAGAALTAVFGKRAALAGIVIGGLGGGAYGTVEAYNLTDDFVSSRSATTQTVPAPAIVSAPAVVAP